MGWEIGNGSERQLFSKTLVTSRRRVSFDVSMVGSTCCVKVRGDLLCDAAGIRLRSHFMQRH
jgi:hypothetical protein